MTLFILVIEYLKVRITPIQVIQEWTTQKLNWQVNACQFGTYYWFRSFEHFVKIAVTWKSSLSRYISHGISGGPEFGLMLVKYSNLSSRTKRTHLLIKFTEDAKVRAVVNGEEENCKSLMQNCEYPVLAI